MKNRSWAVQVGIFVTVGLALFAVGLFLIGDRRLLFVPFHEVESTFTKVTGVQVGTKVRVESTNSPYRSSQAPMILLS